MEKCTNCMAVHYVIGTYMVFFIIRIYTCFLHNILISTSTFYSLKQVNYYLRHKQEYV